MPGADEFRYDAFVSYRHREPEMTWVRETLVPRLEAEGVSVHIDYRDFLLGGILLKQMETAVEHSRYTVAVLTPAYLESNFAELENVMAAHLGLKKSQRRLLLIMRQRCVLPSRLDVLFRLDMTDDTRFEANIQRLVQAILPTADEET